MKHLLVAINSKYIHTSLSVRSIHYYLAKNGVDVPFVEYTINQPVGEVVRELYEQPTNCYLFSCYIWNISYISEIATQLHQLKPDVKIFLGGPEASYKTQELFARLPFLSGIIVGEGESSVLELVTKLSSNEDIISIAGIATLERPAEPRQPINMNDLAFNYPDVADIHHRIFYYESTRGCPYRCSYCLSSVERGVRARSLELTFADLNLFLGAKVRQVKFVDRTFNYDDKRSIAIWQFLIDNDNAITNFHFEITGDILSKEAIAILKTARAGLFQFEVGVQSVNSDTLKEIQRETNLDKLRNNIVELSRGNNIHLHLDLIAGLPYEGFDSFVNSFNWVFSLRPQQFQLGFLKVLGGSQMEQNAKDYGVQYTATPPYQVLKTRWLSYSQLCTLQDAEHMIDHYYNSGRYSYTMEYILTRYSQDDFNFFRQLANCYEHLKGEGPLSKLDYYTVLANFCTGNNIEINSQLMECTLLDIMLHEKPKKLPHWLKLPAASYDRIINFYEDTNLLEKYLPTYDHSNAKQLSRITHLQFFSSNPLIGQAKNTALLADYSTRDITGSAKITKIIELSD